MVDERLLRLTTAANRLGVQPRTVKHWLRLRKLRGVRLDNGRGDWRVPEQEVIRYLQKISSSN